LEHFSGVAVLSCGAICHSACTGRQNFGLGRFCSGRVGDCLPIWCVWELRGPQFLARSRWFFCAGDREPTWILCNRKYGSISDHSIGSLHCDPAPQLGGDSDIGLGAGGDRTWARPFGCGGGFIRTDLPSLARKQDCHLLRIEIVLSLSVSYASYRYMLFILGW